MHTVIAKYKEMIQLWDHGLKESRQKLAWGVDDLERYLHENHDHPAINSAVKTVVKDVIAKGKVQLKDKLDAHKK